MRELRVMNSLNINVDLINDSYNQKTKNENDFMMGDSTYRCDGFSIGKDYLRFEGSTVTRGDLSADLVSIDSSAIIGRGAFSQVYKGVWNRKKLQKYRDEEKREQQEEKKEEEQQHQYYATTVAVKQFCLLESSSQRREMLLKELRALCKVRCDCLVQFEGAFLRDDAITMILEYMDKGSLQQILEQKQKQLQQQQQKPSSSLNTFNQNMMFSDNLCASIAYQIIWGLSYLHHEKILHRDIKPGNILLHSNGSIKLCDFGISSISDQSLHTTVVGTSRYMAPERLRAKPYSRPSDVWSLGLVLLECATGNPVWDDCDSIVTLVMTVEETSLETLIPKHVMSNGLHELLVGCLNQLPSKRMPASLLIKSPWFSSDHKITNVSKAVEIVRHSLPSIL